MNLEVKNHKYQKAKVIGLTSDTFINIDNYVATVIASYLLRDKKVAVVNFDQDGNEKTLLDLIYIYHPEDFYLQDIGQFPKYEFDNHRHYSLELLKFSKVKALISWLEEKDFSLIDNISSLEELRIKLLLQEDVDLVIIKGIEKAKLNVADFDIEDFFKRIKLIATEKDCSILIPLSISPYKRVIKKEEAIYKKYIYSKFQKFADEIINLAEYDNGKKLKAKASVSAENWEYIVEYPHFRSLLKSINN